MSQSRRIGKYEILEEIGRGGFAVVYKARDTRLNRIVALKVLHDVYARNPEVVRRFLSEASYAANLNHPGIVHLNDIEEDNGQPFIAMDYLPGGTLAQRLLNEQLSFDDALLVLTQLAEALDYAHKRQLVHRDLKPVNILFNEEGQAVLVDFGLVKSLIDSGLTVDGTMLGTPQYMSPEQADGRTVDARTDVYALGIVAYELLTGQVPFTADTPLAVINAQLTTPPPDPRQSNAELDERTCSVLLKALAKAPNERYQGTKDFAAALHAAHQYNIQHAQERARLAQLIEQAQAARMAREWLNVQELCVQIMQIERTHPDALSWMQESTTELQREASEEETRLKRARRYESGEEALAAGKWQIALEAFGEVSAGNPDFRDVQMKLAQVRQELQYAELFTKAVEHSETKRWYDACSALTRILKHKSDYRNGEALSHLLVAVEEFMKQYDYLQSILKDTRQEADQVKGIVYLYDRIANLADRQDWSQVPNLIRQLTLVVPGLQQPPRWLDQAHAALELLSTASQPVRINKAKTISPDRVLWLCDEKEMAFIPDGKFLFGIDKEERTLSKFWIDITPVTNAEYNRFVIDTKHPPPAHWKADAPPFGILNHPVVQVSWSDASAYARWAGKELPSAICWEKAARGIDGRTYPWGDEKPLSTICNFDLHEKTTTPVGKYSPHGDSVYGCKDMAGNVWEWTLDNYQDTKYKVIKGGSWNADENSIRTAHQAFSSPTIGDVTIGFRCITFSI